MNNYHIGAAITFGIFMGSLVAGYHHTVLGVVLGTLLWPIQWGLWIFNILQKSGLTG